MCDLLLHAGSGRHRKERGPGLSARLRLPPKPGARGRSLRPLGNAPGSLAPARTPLRAVSGPEGDSNSSRSSRRRVFRFSPAPGAAVGASAPLGASEPSPGPPLLPLCRPLQVTGSARRRWRARRPSPATPRSRARRRRRPCRARAATAAATAPAASSDARAARLSRDTERPAPPRAGGLAPPAARRTNCSPRRHAAAGAPAEG